MRLFGDLGITALHKWSSMVVTDPAFANAGKTRGLQIWRINAFKAEHVPREQYGNFYEGDSYIVLNTKNDNAYDVHFWLGSKTTQDEFGTAAIKTVELDQLLGGLPVQYREVQNHESALFFSYFKQGLKYLEGGHASGFNHVVSKNDNIDPMLFQCKGKRNVRCTQVKLIKESLNLGDVFILDLGHDIYVWMPPESGRLERMKGVIMAESIRDQERGGRPTIHVLDHEWNTDATFWKHFGGKSSIQWIKSPYGGGSDDNYWLDKSADITLYLCSDAGGPLQVRAISAGQQDVKSLDTNDAFILDAGPGGLYVWIGKKCNQKERSKAMEFASQYLETNKRPNWTQVTRVLEGAEPAAFTQWFGNWNDNKKPVQYVPKLFQVSNESGKISVEEIVDFYQQDLDGDDVMILDALNIIYVWVGTGANKEEKAHAKQTAEKFLKATSAKRHKTTTIDVIYQGEETPTFKKFFPEWDDKLFKQRRDYKTMRKILFT
uniref:Villin-1 n=1 Tax=Panagrellus redivivus TaxID=6233 RepID=A0A7E4VEF7_PANRE